MDPQKSPAGSPNRRLLALAGGAAALVAVVVLIVTLASSGGGGDSGTAATTQKEGITPVKEESAKETQQERKAAEPKPLPMNVFLSKANGACERAKEGFAVARDEFPEAATEEAPDVEYSAALVGISEQAVSEFRNLTPPASQEANFDRYLNIQERIKAYDRMALEASEDDDNAAYQRAREKRNLADPERWAAAEAIGLDACHPEAG